MKSPTQQRKSLETIEVAEIKQDAAAIAEAAKVIAENKSKIEAAWERVAKVDSTEQEHKVTARFGEQNKTLLGTLDKAIAALLANKFGDAEKLTLNQGRPEYEALNNVGDDLQTVQIGAAQSAWSVAQTEFKQQSILVIAVVLAGIALGSFVGGVLARSIVATLNTAVGVANRIASGRLDNDVVSGGGRRTRTIVVVVTDDGLQLVEIVGSARMTAGAVGSAARELSQGNDDLSSRTQEQASALEETASSMEEMTATVKQNADNARQANQLAAGAREQAERGGTVVHRAIDAMGEINSSSSKIADIIGVIDEIAFQTN